MVNLKAPLSLYDLEEKVLGALFPEINFHSVREKAKKILRTLQT